MSCARITTRGAVNSGMAISRDDDDLTTLASFGRASLGRTSLGRASLGRTSLGRASSPMRVHPLLAIWVMVAVFLFVSVIGVSARPLIGMGGYVNLPDEDDIWGEFGAVRSYWSSLRDAGALSVHFLPVPEDEIDRLLDMVDGLLLPGGPDVNPARYGEEPHHTVRMMAAEREEFDLALARRALERDMPILGICLGSQEMNVALGGSLIQDIPTFVGTTVRHRHREPQELSGPMHDIRLVRGGALYQIYGQPVIGVNSAHHQAVNRLGEGVVVNARSADGVIEGFEVAGRRFAIGVQFHPERQPEPEGLHARLFNAFVEAARRYRQERSRE